MGRHMFVFLTTFLLFIKEYGVSAQYATVLDCFPQATASVLPTVQSGQYILPIIQPIIPGYDSYAPDFCGPNYGNYPAPCPSYPPIIVKDDNSLRSLLYYLIFSLGNNNNAGCSGCCSGSSQSCSGCYSGSSQSCSGCYSGCSQSCSGCYSGSSQDPCSYTCPYCNSNIAQGTSGDTGSSTGSGSTTGSGTTDDTGSTGSNTCTCTVPTYVPVPIAIPIYTGADGCRYIDGFCNDILVQGPSDGCPTDGEINVIVTTDCAA